MMSFTLENPLSPYFIGITLAVYLVTASTLPQLLKGSRNNRRFLLFYILTGIASLGIFVAADFFTLFCFFEIMTFVPSPTWVVMRARLPGKLPCPI